MTGILASSSSFPPASTVTVPKESAVTPMRGRNLIKGGILIGAAATALVAAVTAVAIAIILFSPWSWAFIALLTTAGASGAASCALLPPGIYYLIPKKSVKPLSEGSSKTPILDVKTSGLDISTNGQNSEAGKDEPEERGNQKRMLQRGAAGSSGTPRRSGRYEGSSGKMNKGGSSRDPSSHKEPSQIQTGEPPPPPAKSSSFTSHPPRGAVGTSSTPSRQEPPKQEPPPRPTKAPPPLIYGTQNQTATTAPKSGAIPTPPKIKETPVPEVEPQKGGQSSNLLDQIKQGKALKKVDKSQEGPRPPAQQPTLTDTLVKAMEGRREAMKEGEEEHVADGDDWSDNE